MSIAASLNTLRGVRDAIRDAIVGKGGTLPPGSPMESYAAAITNLPSGSGGGSVEIPFRSRLTVPGDTDPWHLTNLTATKVTDYAFRADTLLTTVSLPLATSIGTYAFYNCTKLTTVSLPAVTSIGNNAFQYCSALTTPSIPLATSIGNNAFQYCSSLTTVSLPAATGIGSYAFSGCWALTSLTLSKNQVATLSATNAFTSTPIASGTGYIYVPDDLVDQYKAATNWATYANQILPISQKP